MKNILKISLSLAGALAFCAVLFAETVSLDGYEFKIKASRDGSVYKKGETAEFVVSAKKDGNPVDGLALSGQITKDSVPVGAKNFKGKFQNGKFAVDGKLDEAGFLKCAVHIRLPKSADGKKGKNVSLLAGAAFSPEEIAPSAPVPDDFDAYWAEQKKILAAIPMNLKLTPLPSKEKGVKLFDVQADTFNGKLSAYMAYPENASPKSLPAVVMAHGAGVRSSGIWGVIGWAKSHNVIALDFNAHGLPNGQPDKYYADLYAGVLKNYPRNNCENRDTNFFRTLYLRLLRAIDVITSQPQWDGKNLLVSGGSQGGGQALAAAALSPKVSAIVAMYPAICDHTGPLVGRTSGWPHFTRIDAKGEFNRKAIEGSRYIDGMNMATRIKCPVFYMINYADNTCEPTTGYSTYNAIKSPKKLWINEESRHSPAKGTPAILRNWAIDRLKADGANIK